MFKFFRYIRYKLLNEKRLNKYFLYAIGEILLVVVGILIAVAIGEWRQSVKKQDELTAYYLGLQYDLNQDKLRLEELTNIFENASEGIKLEIDKMQLDNYNLDSLYSNVPAWMVYVTEFTPNKPTYTEILSSGKLQLFKNEVIKKQILKVYSDLYPELEFRQKASNEFIRANRTINLMDLFRWLKILNNDNKPDTDVKLNNPISQLNHQWLSNKQSKDYLRFENYLTVTLAAYQGFLLRYNNNISEVELLLSLLEKELENSK
jgi:type II secretory pathway pseudopilin PulG